MANDFNPYIPEWWAMGALAILNENLVAVTRFNRDFSDAFAKGGQIINTRRPNKMTATRKHKTTPIAQQDVSAVNVPIALNQQLYTSFEVNDLDQNFSIEQLMTEYLAPAGFAMARTADAIVLAQIGQFLMANNFVGSSGQSTYQNIIDARTQMDLNLAFEDGRSMIIDPPTEGTMLKDNLLIQAYSAGTTEALRAGIVGKIAGMDGYKTSNLRKSQWGPSTVGVQTLTANAAVQPGATTFTTAAQSTVATAANDWVSINGQPYQITAVSGSGPYTFTISRPLTTTEISSGQAIYSFKGVTLSQYYPIGWAEPIVLSPSANQYTPGLGDWVVLNGDLYGIVAIESASPYTVLLDRPLDASVSTAVLMQTVAPSSYCFMGHRDCMTVVMRTLAPTKPGTGVLSAVAQYNGMGVRAQMWYDPAYQNMKVSLDALMGVKILDTNLGMVFAGNGTAPTTA